MLQQSPIKILVDAHVFDGEYQGTRTFIRGLYTELAKKQDIRLYVAAQDTENLEHVFGNAGNQITYLKLRHASGWGRLLFDFPSLIKKHGIDYAHFQYIVNPVKSCRYIVTIHDVIFEDYPEDFPLTFRLSKKYLYKMSAHKADILTTVSAYSADAIRRHLRVQSPIYVTPNGINSKFFEPYNKEAARAFISEKYGIGKFILYVSRIEQRKNHHLLLQAWLDLELYKKGYHLVFLGHQSLKAPALEKALAACSPEVRQYIYRSSTVNDSDLIEFYKAASAFVYPSRAEGFGIPPLEAAALGIPVICSNTSAMSDFTFFGDYHINPDDYELLKEKLYTILENPPGESVLTKISEAVRHNYSWARSAEVLYEAVTEHRKTLPLNL